MAAIDGARAALARLRRDIASIEGRSAAADRLVLDSEALSGGGIVEHGEAAGEGFKPRPRCGKLRLGHGGLDAVLGGGLPLAALHEIRVHESRDGGAAAGFTMALLARLAEAGAISSVVWISEADARREAGSLYAPGLLALGLDPGRIVAVAAGSESEALWAFEAALACRGLGVAVCELRRPALELGATRRCALRAREADVTGLLLRLAGRAEPSAAELRFRVSPAPAGTIGGFARGVGRMAWRLTLEKSRNGRTGEFSVEWNAYVRSFAEPAERRRADPEPGAAAPLYRPADPAGAGGEGGWPGLRRAS
jgi:protein ImuA